MIRTKSFFYSSWLHWSFATARCQHQQTFKDQLRKLFHDWFILIGSKETNQSQNGYLKPPSYNLAIQWIVEAWDKVNPDVISKSFKYCGKILIFELI